MNLPQAMYLLCHDLDHARMGPDNALVRGQLLRAAAVAELCLDGRLVPAGKKATRALPALPDPDDGFLAEVLGAARPGRESSWFSVVDARWHLAEARVREDLAAAGAIEVGRARWLGIVPHRTVTVTDPAALVELRDRVRAVVLVGDPAGAPARDAALAAIAVDGDVHTVFSTADRRRHRDAIRALGARIDAELPGLRTGLSWSIAARRTAASA